MFYYSDNDTPPHPKNQVNQRHDLPESTRDIPVSLTFGAYPRPMFALKHRAHRNTNSAPDENKQEALEFFHDRLGDVLRRN